MTFDIGALRVSSGKNLRLDDIDPRATPGWDGTDKEEGKVRVEELNERLETLQELLYAEGKQRVLVVLQAMDAGGKDGTIRHVFDGVNPSGVRAPAFKRPSSRELAHDYLWRVHKEVPGDGEIVIFNRSHYEDVLVVRVMDIVPEKRWRKRYEHIVEFERMLADEGTTIVKIYLHISKDEQRQRLQDRLDTPDKNWKFEPGDLDMRARWDDFMAAFEEALEKTSTPHAPWFVIPADRKWYRNIAVLEILVQTLEGLNMEYPDAAPGLDQISIE
jgi:PPK2 family polyphosphate:nucleotide phosphotransferase